MFDSGEDEGIFLGYSKKRNAYQCFNKRLNKIVESTSVKADENTSKELEIAVGYDSDEFKEKERKEETRTKEKNHQDAMAFISKTPRYAEKNYSEEQFIRDKRKLVITRSKAAQE